MRLVTRAEIEADVRIPGLLAGTYTPHCARIDPARLARGLAEACERRGVVIYERSPATAIEPGRVTCTAGTLRADIVVRATEAFTTRLPGREAQLPPARLPHARDRAAAGEAWDEIGWASCAPIADQRYQFTYAQRTPDGRIALGGRGLTYKLGGPIREADEAQAAIHAKLEQTLRRLFPAAATVPVSHRWGCFFAAPRDWCMAVDLRPGDRSRPGGRVRGPRRRRVEPRRPNARRPDHRSRDASSPACRGSATPAASWEPEPLRFIAARTIATVAASADAAEDRTGRPARRIGIVRRWLPGR